MASGRLWQVVFLAWQTALFSFPAPLSTLIEICCQRLGPHANQGSRILCMCPSLSTSIQETVMGGEGVRAKKGRKEGRRRGDNRKRGLSVSQCCMLPIHHEVKEAEKNTLKSAHHSFMAGDVEQLCFLLLIYFMTDCPFSPPRSCAPDRTPCSGESGSGWVSLPTQVREVHLPIFAHYHLMLRWLVRWIMGDAMECDIDSKLKYFVICKWALRACDLKGYWWV